MPAPDDTAAPTARKWCVLETSEGEFEVVVDRPEYDSIATIWAGPNAARLIAAAPSLYEALTALVNSADYGMDDDRPLMRNARAALALARGETNG